MSSLYILCGLPFSGKSFFSKDVESKTSIMRVSFDDLWNALVALDGNIPYEKVMIEIEKLITNNLIEGISVVYDSTNMKEEHRDSMLNLTKNIHVDAFVVYFPITVEEMYKRQAQSLIDKSHHIVNMESIHASLEHNTPPIDCIILANEHHKTVLLKKLIEKFPKKTIT